METPVPEQKLETPAEEAPAAEAAPAAAPAESAAPAPTPEPAPAGEPVVEEAASAVFGVGPTLRGARERMGKTLAECSKQLRIRQPFLEALEDGRHRDLPGGTYAAGFLRTYAEYLSLDGEEMVRRFRQEGAGGFATRAELSFPSPVSEGRIPGGAVIFLGIVLSAVAYGGWYVLSTPEPKVAEMVPPLPDRLSSILSRQAALTGEAKVAADAGKSSDDVPKVKEDVVPPPEAEEEKAPQQAAAPAATPVAAPEPPKVEAKPEPAKSEPPKIEAKPESPKAEPPKVEAKPEPTVSTGVDGKIYGTEFADARVVLKATGDDCWIQVREMDGSLLLSRLLRKGDSFRVPNRPGLTLMVGNAGSLDVAIDGRKGPALGAAGQVRRDIRLDPDKLSSGG